ncbi:hypothetical protein FQZ97_770730 [compost metagenome]
MEGLQDFDAGLAITGAVIQQETVPRIEVALQLDPHIGRIGKLCQLGDSDGCGQLPGLMGRQQLALFLGTRQLPETQADQPGQQQQHQQTGQPAGAKGAHRVRAEARAKLVILHLQDIPLPPELRMLKVAIVLLLLATVVSLFSGLFFLVKDEGRSSRVVNSLTVRVTLTALTVALIAWGFYSGQLVPQVTW